MCRWMVTLVTCRSLDNSVNGTEFLVGAKQFDANPVYVNSGFEWLGKIPGHWETARIWQICQSISGGTPVREEPSYWNGSIPWVSPKDMKRRMLDDTEETITERGQMEGGLRLIRPPAVLIVVRGMILAHSFPVALATVPLTRQLHKFLFEHAFAT